MVLKENYKNGDFFGAGDANEITSTVNENSSRIATNESAISGIDARLVELEVESLNFQKFSKSSDGRYHMLYETRDGATKEWGDIYSKLDGFDINIVREPNSTVYIGGASGSTVYIGGASGSRVQIGTSNNGIELNASGVSIGNGTNSDVSIGHGTNSHVSIGTSGNVIELDASGVSIGNGTNSDVSIGQVSGSTVSVGTQGGKIHCTFDTYSIGKGKSLIENITNVIGAGDGGTGVAIGGNYFASSFEDKPLAVFSEGRCSFGFDGNDGTQLPSKSIAITKNGNVTLGQFISAYYDRNNKQEIIINDDSRVEGDTHIRIGRKGNSYPYYSSIELTNADVVIDGGRIDIGEGSDVHIGDGDDSSVTIGTDSGMITINGGATYLGTNTYLSNKPTTTLPDILNDLESRIAALEGNL